MIQIPTPTLSRVEELALFRYAIVADLVVSDLPVGGLQEELKHRAKRRYRPPGAKTSRTFHWKTLQRWLRAAREGLARLESASRKRGFGLNLSAEARQLLLEMREEHPNVAADVLLDEAVRNGVIERGAVSVPTVRRLFARAELPRTSADRTTRRKDRRRWEADRPCRIWHADVCHVWRREPDGKAVKACIHGILDDHSRLIISIEARESETENDLLSLLVEALLRYPAPEIFYVDNGATYRGDVLAMTLSKLGIRLVQPEPYNPEARGKMERFWRTLRQRLVDTLHGPMSLAELQVALLAWVDADYHMRKHAGLMGATPLQRFREGVRSLAAPRTLEDLAKALEVPRVATVRKDATFSVDGTVYEVRGRHLSGKKIQVILDPFTGRPIRVEHDGQLLLFSVCDARSNARRGRGDVEDVPSVTTPFDRVAGLLQAARKVQDA
ncbi:MAG TPA: DDE-type integrase/transposase/recombinase [Microthrixaceae bacterium]|nr:DDE-type integrase/transposase/recombinase [Microthrixaceae bacterium]HNE76410.1 DDE-type integrase/transposase/recombinase [Microthrixaceae bacterium]HNF63755.1 DDE-type integrase/transposase/recombinase [Rhodocyclaceae bacterium]